MHKLQFPLKETTSNKINCAEVSWKWEVSWRDSFQWSVMEFPHHGNLHESKLETWLHQEEPERYTSRVEAPSLCCICEVRHGICQHYMGSSFH